MASHQTVRLSRGSHRSPGKGVCVMELASMLAGEKFSDRPRSVSPVIRNFLRVYNDGLDDRARQALYPVAARIVGTHAARRVERTRARHCVEWIERLGGRPAWTLRAELRPAAVAGSAAARRALADPSAAGRRRALALVDELIELGDSWVGIPANPEQLLARAKRGAEASDRTV